MFEACFSLLIFSFLLLGSPWSVPLAIAATGAVFGIHKRLTSYIGLVIGYVMVAAIYSQFLLPHENTTWAYLLTALVCVMVVVCIDLTWLLLGKILKPVMQHPRTGRILRVVFAVAMILVVFWMVIKNIIK